MEVWGSKGDEDRTQVNYICSLLLFIILYRKRQKNLTAKLNNYNKTETDKAIRSKFVAPQAPVKSWPITECTEFPADMGQYMNKSTV